MFGFDREVECYEIVKKKKKQRKRTTIGHPDSLVVHCGIHTMDILFLLLLFCNGVIKEAFPIVHMLKYGFDKILR